MKSCKEYLNSDRNYEFVLSTEKDDGFIEIPEGADFYVKSKIIEDNFFFCMDNSGVIETYDTMLKNLWHREMLTTKNLSKNYEILWQREQDEPFLTPECTLNDQYAEIEQVRQVEIHGTAKAEPDLNFGAAQASGGAKMRENNHYFINVSDVDEVDFYEIAKRYNVTDPAVQHILKKCLAIGNRGHKDLETDLKDILKTAKRALQINGFGE